MSKRIKELDSIRGLAAITVKNPPIQANVLSYILSCSFQYTKNRVNLF